VQGRSRAAAADAGAEGAWPAAEVHHPPGQVARLSGGGPGRPARRVRPSCRRGPAAAV